MGDAVFAQPDGWPSRPITMVVPASAGSGTDLLAREVANRLGAALKQAVIVDNKPGASGVVGTQAVVRAAPDGYTLLLVGTGIDNIVAGSRPGQSPTRVDNRSMWSLGGTYSFTTALTLGAQYWHIDQQYHTPGAPDAKGDFSALLADYALSKRTSVYAALEYTHLDDLQLTNSKVTPAVPNGATNRTAYMVGIRHRF